MANRFRWSFYIDSHGNWRWKRKASEAQPVAYSSGFQHKGDCINDARRFGYVVEKEITPLERDPFSDVRRPEPE